MKDDLTDIANIIEPEADSLINEADERGTTIKLQIQRLRALIASME